MVSRQVQNVSISLAANFGQAGHGPLERVAVQVRGRRRHDRVTLVAFLRVGADLDGGDRALLDRDPHVGLPTLGGQRPCGVKNRQSSAPLPAIGVAGARRLPFGPIRSMHEMTCGGKPLSAMVHANDTQPSRYGLAQRPSRDPRAEGGRGSGSSKPARSPREKDGLLSPARRTSFRPRGATARASFDCEGRWITPGADRLPHPPRLRRRPGARIRAAGSLAQRMKRSPAKAAEFFRPCARPARRARTNSCDRRCGGWTP